MTEIDFGDEGCIELVCPKCKRTVHFWNPLCDYSCDCRTWLLRIEVVNDFEDDEVPR
jgi:hypothetical protein